jgi:hypothetical protein
MSNPELNGHAGHEDAAAADEAQHHDAADGEATNGQPSEAMTVAATVGVVAVGAALWEVALLPGIALGVAAMLAPKYVPRVSSALTPMFRSSVRGVYKFGQKTREMMAEAKEQVNDIVAEVHAEGDAATKAEAAPAPKQ